MSVRLRPLLAAGAIAVVVLLSRHWTRSSVRSESALAAMAAPPLAPAPLPPVHSVPPSPEPPVGDPACRELFRSGRFADLLRRASNLNDDAEQTRWLDACARLAPPRLVAEHALLLSPGPLRESLLETALARWALDAPVELGEWASAHLDDGRSLDFTLARIIEHTDALHRPIPSVLAWVRLVRDSGLRFHALRAVVREWADSDPDAALRFAETTPDLSADERIELLALFVPTVTET
jgi:hypothetical protein